jgi:hypothetical protein
LRDIHIRVTNLFPLQNLESLQNAHKNNLNLFMDFKEGLFTFPPSNFSNSVHLALLQILVLFVLKEETKEKIMQIWVKIFRYTSYYSFEEFEKALKESKTLSQISLPCEAIVTIIQEIKAIKPKQLLSTIELLSKSVTYNVDFAMQLQDVLKNRITLNTFENWSIVLMYLICLF